MAKEFKVSVPRVMEEQIKMLAGMLGEGDHCMARELMKLGIEQKRRLMRQKAYPFLTSAALVREYIENDFDLSKLSVDDRTEASVRIKVIKASQDVLKYNNNKDTVIEGLQDIKVQSAVLMQQAKSILQCAAD